LNRTGVEAAQGDWVFFLNDDAVMRTVGWDDQIRWATSRYPDTICLIHTNDLLMQHHLCVFPLVSRWFALNEGVLDTSYRRYCIDDHIEDIFLRLAALGEVRLQYLPEVIVEHLNAQCVNGRREYHAEPGCLAIDQAHWEKQAPRRQEVAQRLFREIQSRKVAHRLKKIDYPLRWDRQPRIETISAACSIRELNNRIDSATSDFLWIPSRKERLPPFSRPPMEAIHWDPQGIYLDRRRVSTPYFEERFQAFFVELDFCIRHGIACPMVPRSWLPNATLEQYEADRTFFVVKHPHVSFVDVRPKRPGLLQRAWGRWQKEGWIGVLTSLTNAARRAVTRSVPPESQASTPKAP
jgi:hypothetical protein